MSVRLPTNLSESFPVIGGLLALGAVASAAIATIAGKAIKSWIQTYNSQPDENKPDEQKIPKNQRISNLAGVGVGSAIGLLFMKVASMLISKLLPRTQY